MPAGVSVAEFEVCVLDDVVTAADVAVAEPFCSVERISAVALVSLMIIEEAASLESIEIDNASMLLLLATDTCRSGQREGM